jgi:hypothetical protein
MLLRWITLLIVFYSIPAYALDLTEFGMLGISAPSAEDYNDPSLGASLGIGYGGGLSLGMPLSPRVDFEITLLFATRSFSRRSDSMPNTSYKLTTAQIPILIRYWFSKSISLGGGPYFIHGLGNVKTPDSIKGYNEYSWNTDDFGIVASFRYRTQLNEVIYLILDERILVGAKNVDYSNRGSLRFYDFQSWAGISFKL